MARPKKWIRITLFTVVLIGLGLAWMLVRPQLAIGSGYAAKKMCSCVFIADRTSESVQAEDLGFGPLSLTKTKIFEESQSVRSSFFGLSPRKAVYRGGLGCILLDGKDDYELRLDLNRSVPSDSLYWPHGSRIHDRGHSDEIDMTLLYNAITNAFDPSMSMDSAKTRAVVVVHRGQLIAEKYARGFDAQTEILGWSMTKSITAAMVGILMKNKKIELDQRNLFEAWSDDRSTIQLSDLMQMQSGLNFEESYGGVSDATKMLFTEEDISRIPKDRQMGFPPGKQWSYSSGTTNLIQAIIRRSFERHEDYLRFPYDSLFNRLGMANAVMETDESGTYIGSSYCYASPRDWARFGLLFLNNGDWFGDQIIDSSFVQFVRKPASQSGGRYGGQFWLNVGQSNLNDAPEDLFSCNGFQGQYVFIIPSYDLVVVRMGLAEWPNFDANHFLKEILAAIPKNTPENEHINANE